MTLATGLLCSSFTTNETSYVYICHSQSAYSYHYKQDCKGLSRCTHDVLKVTLEDAKTKYKRKLCGW